MPKKIMLIDPDEHTALAIAAMIQSYGMTCKIVMDTECGMAFVAKGETCDVVVIDLKHSDHSGLAFIDRLVQMVPPTPIVIIADFPEDLEMEAIKHGAQEYLRKRDLNSRTLENALRRAYHRFRSMPLFRPTLEKLTANEERLDTMLTESGSMKALCPAPTNESESK